MMNRLLLVVLAITFFSCGKKELTKEEDIIFNSLKTINDYDPLDFSEADTLSYYYSSSENLDFVDSVNKYNGIIDSLEYEHIFHYKNTSLEQFNYMQKLLPYDEKLSQYMIESISKGEGFDKIKVIDTAYRISHCYLAEGSKNCYVFEISNKGRIIKSEQYRDPAPSD